MTAIAGILAKIVGQASFAVLRAGYKQLSEVPPFKKASDETCAAFPLFEIRLCLTKWCESDVFQSILQRAETGDKPLADDEIADSFIKIGEFYAAEDTISKAKEILALFFQKLEVEIIKSKDGLVTVASRQEKLHEETRDEFRKTVQPISEQITEIKSMLTNASDKSISPHEVEERIYHTRVDTARELHKLGKYVTARKMLQKLREEIAPKNVSKSLLFRIASNIGACCAHLGETPTAIKEFEFAYTLEPDNPLAISNASAIALEQGDKEKSLKLAEVARQKSPKDEVITANYLQALLANGKEAEFQKAVESNEWIRTNPECCFAVANVLFESERYSEAETFLRGAIKQTKYPRIFILLAHSLVRPTQKTLLGEPIFSWKLSQKLSVELAEADSLLSEAITLLSEREERILSAHAYVLRADVRRMQGRDADAILDADSALMLSPSDEFATQIKAMSLFHAGRLNESVSCFESIKNPAAQKQVLLPFSIACLVSGKPSKVITLLAQHFETGIQNPKEIKTVDILISAYDKDGKTDLAEKVLAELRSKWPTHPDTLVAAAHHFHEQGKPKEAIDAFSEALTYSTNQNRDIIALELADYYYHCDEFSKAADLYGPVINPDANNGITQRYLASLFNSGDYKAALKLAQQIRKNGEPLVFASHIEARILIQIGDLKTAYQILKRLAELNPKLFQYKIEAADCARRRTEIDDAKRLISEIDFEDIKAKADFLIRVAQLRLMLGMPDVVKFAYQARRMAFSSAETHATYAMLCVNSEGKDNSLIDCETVEKDCAVILKTGDTVIAYTILDDSNISAERGEISLSEAKNMNLIGRKKGDRFVLRQNAWQTVECTVLDIQSKYKRAFQETLEKFQTLFPTNQLIQPIHGEFAEFKEGFFKQLDELENSTKTVFAHYQNKKLTIEALAHFLQRPLIHVWGMLAGGHYSKLFAYSGRIEDVEADLQRAGIAGALMLELTGILTLAQLGLLQELPKRFQKLYSTQAVLDEITRELNENAISKGGMTLGKIGKDYIKHEVTTDQIEKNKRFFESIREFIASHVTIVPVTSELETENSRWTKLKDFLGDVSTTCILAASEYKAVLCSDDEMLRALARNESKVEGFGTQTLLQELLRTSVISQIQYTEAIGKLVLFNYKFVSINAETLMWILEKTKFEITEEVKLFLEGFKGPECTIESAIGVLAEVTKRIWLEGLLYQNKLAALHGLLETLTTGRAIKQTVELFKLVIVDKFFLIPTTGQAVARHIDNWYSQKLNQQGLLFLQNTVEEKKP